ncbi:hypothetical protein Sinme_5316 [Sinorhizobium meliloti AK83]|nr:hypothetical protein Sinme_5316 [Sinorhizobium meliloti AK83]SEJ68153.1 hypothetical protein SAMN04244575_05670 [Sinorhizobium meliloti]
MRICIRSSTIPDNDLERLRGRRTRPQASSNVAPFRAAAVRFCCASCWRRRTIILNGLAHSTHRASVEARTHRYRTDKRYVRRDESGKFKESVDVGRSLSSDRRTEGEARSQTRPGRKGRSLKIATYNVNGVNGRLDVLLRTRRSLILHASERSKVQGANESSSSARSPAHRSPPGRFFTARFPAIQDTGVRDFVVGVFQRENWTVGGARMRLLGMSLMISWTPGRQCTVTSYAFTNA